MTNSTLPPKRYLFWSVIMIFVFWPFGIPALVNASKVDRYWFSGNHEASIRASKKAKRWCLALPILLLITLGVMAILSMFGEF